MIRSFFIAVILFACSTGVAHASVVITEIMYDAEGSDANKEWIEVWNDGGDVVDMAGWKFVEDGSNHGLTEARGGTIIPAGVYAIIAHDADVFISDNPSFSGIVFDSSFSLNNTGETISLKDPDLVETSVVTYSSDMGATGDGLSLQKNGSSWIAGAPSPGSAYSTGGDTSTQEDTSTSEDTTTSETSNTSRSGGSAGGSNTSWPSDSSISVRIEMPGSVAAGSDILMQGEAVGGSKESLPIARYMWSFGDGGRAEGTPVIHAYLFPGDYVIHLEVVSGNMTGSQSKTITVFAPDISISHVSHDYIEVTNHTSREIDLSEWRLGARGVVFPIPRTTILLPSRSIKFPSKITQLFPWDISEVTLYYRNGNPVLLRQKEVDTPPPQVLSQSSVSSQKSQSFSTPLPPRNDEQETLSIEGQPINNLHVSAAALISVSHPTTSSSAESTSTVANVAEPSSRFFLYAFIVLILASALSIFFIKRPKQSPASDIAIVE